MIKDAQRIAVFGASGSGKSTLVHQLLKTRPRVVVFDPLMEYARGYEQVSGMVALVKALKRRWNAKALHVAYVPKTGEDYTASLHDIAVMLQRVQQGYFRGHDPRKITFVVEEMNLSYPVTGLSPNRLGFRDLCSRGRHYGIEVIGVSQRMAEVNTNFRGNASETYFFRLAEHNDLTAARKVLGPQAAERLRAVPKFHYLKRAEDGVITAGKTARR